MGCGAGSKGIVEALKAMRERRLRTLEVRPAAQTRFVNEVQQQLQRTVWQSGCKSWYLTAQGRNISLWPGFTFTYRIKTRRFNLQPYRSEPA